MVQEARLRETEAGLVADGDGWFVMNARDARWMENPGRGFSLPLTGLDEYEAETLRPPQDLTVVQPRRRA